MHYHFIISSSYGRVGKGKETILNTHPLPFPQKKKKQNKNTSFDSDIWTPYTDLQVPVNYAI